MDPRDELNEERKRRIQAEEELASWQNNAIQNLPPEQIAANIQRQQLEALTYNLMRQKQFVDDLSRKLQAKEKELTEAVANIKNLESQIEDLTEELGKTKKVAPAQTAPKGETSGQRFGVSGLPTDEELESILSTSTPGSKTIHTSPGMERAKRDPKGFKDFIQLMRRMERIKLYDAALLLDHPQDDVLLWARALERKGYITVHGLREKTLLATDKMIKTR
jgi:hypothetical protein